MGQNQSIGAGDGEPWSNRCIIYTKLWLVKPRREVDGERQDVFLNNYVTRSPPVRWAAQPVVLSDRRVRFPQQMTPGAQMTPRAPMDKDFEWRGAGCLDTPIRQQGKRVARGQDLSSPLVPQEGQLPVERGRKRRWRAVGQRGRGFQVLQVASQALVVG